MKLTKSAQNIETDEVSSKHVSSKHVLSRWTDEVSPYI
ncbi:Uncharacterised protein [Streptococcus pneumoniae]|nr:Uncharacterised protein [Streptococcus pneumoniae]